MADNFKIVVVGAGFGGLSVTRGLANSNAEITLIDRRNYHLFQPLLYQVATAGLSPAEIAWPIRSIVNQQKNVQVIMDEVQDVDITDRKVRCKSHKFDYDFLVIASGARHSYFGNDVWQAFAPGLKNIEDATDIRRRILMAFELAEMEDDLEEQKRLLTFVIVGAGPTGVELSGAVIELARKALISDFRKIKPQTARIILVEAGPRVLPTFPEKLSQFAQNALNNLGVEIRLGKAIVDCSANGVTIGTQQIACATVLWAAGVEASPAGGWIDAECDRVGRIIVSDQLEVPGFDNVFAIGDTALVKDQKGLPLPGTAPVAKQQGKYVAKVIRDRLCGANSSAKFYYRHNGNLATIGRRAAVIDFGAIKLKGRLAWWLWGFAHIYYLINMRNRILVAVQWLWSYITFQRGARLITGRNAQPKSPES